MWHSITKELAVSESDLYLCGSICEGYDTNCSDIDIICNCKYANYIYSERFIFQNKPIHLIVFPKYKLTDYLICDIYTPSHIYANMWEKCVYLTDDCSDFTVSMHNYITRLFDAHMEPSDDFLYLQLQKLSALCSDLSCQSNNQLLIASELLLTINRFIAGKHCDVKHLSRALVNNGTSQKFQDLYSEAVCTKDYGHFLGGVKDFIKKYKPSLDNESFTTAVSYNKIPDGPFIIFLPEVGHITTIRKILKELSSVIERVVGHNYYCFGIEPNQALDAGSYICVRCNDKEESSMVYQSIVEYHKKNSTRFLNNGIKLLYPYRTAFSSGLFFGGFAIQEHLSIHFCSIHSMFQEKQDIGSGSTLYALTACIYRAFDDSLNDGKDFLYSVRDSLLADVIDPIGVYNIEQMKIMSSALSRKKGTRKMVSPGSLNFTSLTELINRLIGYVLSLSKDEIIFPSISSSGNEQRTLLRYILLHLQDIMMLSFPQRHETLSYYLSE